MIDFTHLLPVFFLISRKDQESSKPKWYPTHSDVEDLAGRLKGYTQTRINGKLQTKFSQYCKTIGLISFDEYGEIVVHNPGDYYRLSETHDKLERKENAIREAHFAAHPEEKKKLFQKIKELGAKFRTI